MGKTKSNRMITCLEAVTALVPFNLCEWRIFKRDKQTNGYWQDCPQKAIFFFHNLHLCRKHYFTFQQKGH